MAAGVFGYLGYDMVRLMEELPARQSRSDRHPRRDPDPPDAGGRVRCGQGQRSPWSRRCGPTRRQRARPRCARAQERLSAVVDALDRPLDKAAPTVDAGPLDVRGEVQHHAGRVPRDGAARPRTTSLAGDIFQVVLSQRFEAPFALPPFSLYRALRRVNPAPFLYFLDFGDFAIAARARKSWCACATARSPSARSPAPGRAARRRTRTRRWRRSCSPIRRSAPSI